MTYIPSTHLVQIAPEAVYGDGSAATIQPPGITNFRVDPRVEGQQLNDKRGTTMPSHESFIKKRWSEGIIEGFLNYNEFYLYLDGMFGLANEETGGVRTYLGTLDWATEVEKSLAIRYGQSGLLYLVEGVLPYDLHISGATGEALKFSNRFFARPAEDGASFASLSDDVVDWAFGYHSVIYFDAGEDATPGTTPMTDLGFRFEAKITANRKPVWHMNNQEHDSWRPGKWGGSMKLVLEADATLLAHVGDILDETTTPKAYAVRVRTTDGSNVLDIDFVGEVITPPVLIPDEDGVVTVELDLVPKYGSTLTSCWGVELTIP